MFYLSTDTGLLIGCVYLLNLRTAFLNRTFGSVLVILLVHVLSCDSHTSVGQSQSVSFVSISHWKATTFNFSRACCNEMEKIIPVHRLSCFHCTDLASPRQVHIHYRKPCSGCISLVILLCKI